MPGPFIPLLKVDAAQRLVFGQIDETPDRAGEVFDYDSSKPLFKGWSDDIAKATGGASQGNVRAMHGNVAAGKLVKINFDDQAKSVGITAKIVDDAEWEKVVQGVYTGFSPGGSYVKRWQDGEHTRYTAQPSEISIVDLPCIPSAKFTFVKGDGLSEERHFAKSGARNSKADQERIQAVHDHAAALGACCGGGASDQAGDDADKAAPSGDLRKVLSELSGLRSDLAKVAGERDALAKRVAALEAQPVSGGPVLTVVEKAAEMGAGAAPTDDLAKITAMPPGPAKAAALSAHAQRLTQPKE